MRAPLYARVGRFRSIGLLNVWLGNSESIQAAVAAAASQYARGSLPRLRALQESALADLHLQDVEHARHTRKRPPARRLVAWTQSVVKARR